MRDYEIVIVGAVRRQLKQINRDDQKEFLTKFNRLLKIRVHTVLRN